MYSRKVVTKSVITASIVLAFTHAQFGVASPYRASIAGNNKELKVIAAQLHDGVTRRGTPNLHNLKKTLQFSTAIQGIGRFKIRLNDFRFKSWDSQFQPVAGFTTRDMKDVVLVTGSAVSSGKELPVGGGIYREKSGGRPVLHLVLNSERSKGRSVYLKGYVDGQSVSEVKVTSVPSVRLKALACGNDDHDLHNKNTTQAVSKAPMVAADSTDGSPSLTTSALATTATTISTSNPKVAMVATEFDYKFYQAYGDSSNAQIATLVAAASAIYQRQIGLRLQISAQHGFTTAVANPFTTSDAGDILTTFRTYSLANNQLGDADIYHLFSGDDFVGSTIGLAWVGVTCSVQDYSFGITQKFNPSADASITAHEIGHNLGASHDTNDAASIMAPYVNVPGSTYFSQTSIDQIVSHLSSSVECLDPDTNPQQPTPVPTVIATPVASDTATPVPTPTPTLAIPSDTSPINLTVSGTKAGTVSLRYAVSSFNNQPTDCQISLYGAAKLNTVGTRIYSFTPTSAVTVLRLANIKRVSIPRQPYLAFTARNSCTGSSVTWSNTQNISLSMFSKRAAANVTASQILQSIKTALSALKKRG